MINYKNKSNSEILLDIKQLQNDHESIKNELIRLYDIMENIEKEFKEANNELHKRLTGNL